MMVGHLNNEKSRELGKRELIHGDRLDKGFMMNGEK
jgi:hypothetical protein